MKLLTIAFLILSGQLAFAAPSCSGGGYSVEYSIEKRQAVVKRDRERLKAGRLSCSLLYPSGAPRFHAPIYTLNCESAGYDQGNGFLFVLDLIKTGVDSYAIRPPKVVGQSFTTAALFSSGGNVDLRLRCY